MKEIAPVAAEIDALSAEATTSRVRRALRPQAAALAAVRDANARLIHQIDDYLQPIDRAVRAHLEWEQYMRIVDNVDAATGLRASTDTDGTRSTFSAPPLAGDLDLEAIRRSREELTAEAARANARLLDVLGTGEPTPRKHQR